MRTIRDLLTIVEKHDPGLAERVTQALIKEALTNPRRPAPTPIRDPRWDPRTPGMARRQAD